MDNLNFFSWIRNGVRQSVLLGVSDAVEQLGTPAPADELHPSVTGFLQMDRASQNAPALAGSTASGGKQTGRRRLGKSLKDIGPQQKSS